MAEQELDLERLEEYIERRTSLILEFRDPAGHLQYELFQSSTKPRLWFIRTTEIEHKISGFKAAIALIKEQYPELYTWICDFYQLYAPKRLLEEARQADIRRKEAQRRNTTTQCTDGTWW